MSTNAHAPTRTGRFARTPDLRLTPGVLRGPRFGRSRLRLSETAAPARPGAGGAWIERALLDMPSGASEAPARIADLMTNLVRLRVGGEFWAGRPAWPSTIDLVVKADSEVQVRERVRFALDLAGAGRIGVLLPQAHWSKAAGRALTTQGLAWTIGAADPWAILDAAASVVVGGDEDLGLLALLAGRTVYCRSSGYLAGWGVTQDAPDIAPRGRREIWQIAAAALVAGVRYFDPYSGRVTACESVVDQLSDWRRVIDEDRGLACCTGIALWKRARFRTFLSPQARKAPVLAGAQRCVVHAAATNGAIAVWPSRAPAGLEDLASKAGVPLRRVEDGFLRSVGLGSDLLPPCSIVLDRRGIYYDPSRPSDLEVILTETEFSAALRGRARRLIDTLVARGLTKYNTGGGGYARPARRRVVLVPGQVEDDQSWRLGGGDCVGNLDLLRRARRHEPDAFIIYKPHPDVEAGNRVGAVLDAEALQYADQIVRDVAMPALLDSVDAVHVLTSLTGFEALLREREVVTHGQPFFSGWGLTRDLAPPPRRGRKLALAELVAGTLILYPRYLDPVTGLLCPPEVLVERLAGRRQGAMAGVLALRRLRRSVEGASRLTAKTSPLQDSGRI